MPFCRTRVGARQTAGASGTPRPRWPQARPDHGGGRYLELRFSLGRGGDGRDQDAEARCPGQASSTGRPTAHTQRGARSRRRRRAAVREPGMGAVRGSCTRREGDPGLAVWPRSPRPCTHEAPAGGVRNGPPAGANVLPGGHHIPPREARSKQSSDGVRLQPPPRRARPPRRQHHLSLAARGGWESSPQDGRRLGCLPQQRGCRRGRRPSNEGGPRPPTSPPAGANRRHGHRGGEERPGAVRVWLRAAFRRSFFCTAARGPRQREIWTDRGTRSGSLTSGSRGAGGSPSRVGDRTTPATDCKRGRRRGRGRSVVSRAVADVTYVIATGASTVGDHSALARAAPRQTRWRRGTPAVGVGGPGPRGCPQQDAPTARSPQQRGHATRS